MNKLKTPFWKYAVRLSALPFVAAICLIKYACHLIHYCIHFVRYGGEIVILDASIKTFLIEQAEAKKQQAMDAIYNEVEKRRNQ